MSTKEMTMHPHPLVNYCNTMNMSYSYKPVLIMSLVAKGGQITVSEAVNYFIDYYGRRLELGLMAERSNSIYSHLNCTSDQIASNIKTNPVNALLNSEFFEYDRRKELLRIKEYYWSTVDEGVKHQMNFACQRRLDRYFAHIAKENGQEIICFHKPDEENGYLSNWYRSRFTAHGKSFTSMEQYMMYRKAVLFEDVSARDEIMRINDVAEIKEIGRKVINYNERIWSGQRQLIVYQGLKSKFSQNAYLKSELMDTGNALLAECAVSDHVWGIGLSMTDDRRLSVNQWKGENLLGFALMQVRNNLQGARAAGY